MINLIPVALGAALIAGLWGLVATKIEHRVSQIRASYEQQISNERNACTLKIQQIGARINAEANRKIMEAEAAGRAVQPATTTTDVLRLCARSASCRDRAAARRKLESNGR